MVPCKVLSSGNKCRGEDQHENWIAFVWILLSSFFHWMSCSANQTYKILAEYSSASPIFTTISLKQVLASDDVWDISFQLCTSSLWARHQPAAKTAQFWELLQQKIFQVVALMCSNFFRLLLKGMNRNWTLTQFKMSFCTTAHKKRTKTKISFSPSKLELHLSRRRKETIQ